MKKAKILSLICCLLVICLITGCGKKNNNPEQNGTNNNNAAEESISINDTQYASYTADFNKDSRSIDYYWNINTETFDKTKFDKNISFFGNLINTKITGKTLNDLGYKLSEVSAYSCNDEFGLTEKTKDYTQKCGQLTNTSKSYPIDYTSVGLPKLINFDNNDDFTSDNVEVYFKYNKTNQYVDFVTETEESNIIFPYFNGIKYDEMTIDLIIDNMGVPTYVSDRTDPEDTPLTFSYYYVYDDYVFKFDFTYITSIKFTGVEYMGIKTFNHSRLKYDYDKDGNVVENNYTLKQNFENEYKEYLKTIKK